MPQPNPPVDEDATPITRVQEADRTRLLDAASDTMTLVSPDQPVVYIETDKSPRAYYNMHKINYSHAASTALITNEQGAMHESLNVSLNLII